MVSTKLFCPFVILLLNPFVAANDDKVTRSDVLANELKSTNIIDKAKTLNPEDEFGKGCTPGEFDDCQKATIGIMMIDNNHNAPSPKMTSYLGNAMKCIVNKCACQDKEATFRQVGKRKLCLKEGLGENKECIHLEECERKYTCLPKDPSGKKTCQSSSILLQPTSIVMLIILLVNFM